MKELIRYHQDWIYEVEINLGRVSSKHWYNI